MSMRIVCPGCGRGIKAADSFAGRRVPCPGCGTPVDFPSAAPPPAPPPPPPPPPKQKQFDPLDVLGVPQRVAPPHPAAPTPQPPIRRQTVQRVDDLAGSYATFTDTVRCPFCDEEIKRFARKCKHCGEFLDDDARRSGNAATTVIVNASNPAGNINPGTAALLSFLIPGTGQMYRGNVLQGLVWFIIVPIGYLCLIFPGLLLHFICIALAGAPVRERR